MDNHPWPCVVHRSVRETVERVRHFRAMRGRSLSGRAGGAPTTSVGVATRVSQARRSTSRSTLASSRLWRSRQVRAMSPSWPCSSPMRAQSPCPLIVRQVLSHAASSGCARPARRSPRPPVWAGQRQRRPAPTSALSSPTALSGMVFAPSASRRQRSPGKTPCVAGGEKPRGTSSPRGIPTTTPRCHTTSGTTEVHCPWRSVRVDRPWSTRVRRWRRTRSVRPRSHGPLAVVRCRSRCPL